MRTATLLLLVTGLACTSYDTYRQHDTYGHYATASDFVDLDRTEFIAAISDGLRDFDARLSDLRARSNALNEDAREDFLDQYEDLSTQRIQVENELQRLEASLPTEWDGMRDDVLDDYLALREDLDDAHEDVFDEA